MLLGSETTDPNIGQDHTSSLLMVVHRTKKIELVHLPKCYSNVDRITHARLEEHLPQGGASVGFGFSV